MQHNKETENAALLYAYGELAEGLDAFEKHLAACPHCQNIVQSAKAINAILPLKPAPAVNYAPLNTAAPINNFWNTLNFKRLIPATALLVLFIAIGLTSYKIAAVKANSTRTQLIAAAQYIELEDSITRLESDINEINNPQQDLWEI